MNVHHLKDSGDNNPANLVLLCVACHTVLHVGRSLMHGIVEVWESEVSQVEIVRRTRESIRQGLTLDIVKSQLPLKPGQYPSSSTKYANDLIKRMGKEARAYLDEPLCVVFVKFDQWQIGKD
jgi:Ethanolamine utilization protein EutJ (predicted chaperonin)